MSIRSSGREEDPNARRRVAALYDVHGNLPALEAVLGEVVGERVDAIVVGGDVVPGPMPRACLSALGGLSLPTYFLRGNGEREVLMLRAGGTPEGVPEAYLHGMRWVGREISDERAEWLGGWPPTLDLEVDGLGRVHFCHATPRSDREIFTERTDERRLLPVLEPTGADVVVCGHTHMQFERDLGRLRVVNAGSVGMPFGQPGAYWALLGPDIELRRTFYDLRAAADRIRTTRYPDAEAFAENSVLSPPSAETMIEHFERASLR